MSRLSCGGGRLLGILALAATLISLTGAPPEPAGAELRVAPGLRVDEVVTGLTRPIELAFQGPGRLVVLSHGWRGDAAELHWVDLSGTLPADLSRAPRVVIPYAEGPRKIAFGSLAVDPRTGDLFLGEENGNRIYRFTADQKLALFAVGLHHLVGGSSLAFDGQGRLVVLDFASPEGRLRSESAAPPGLDWLASEAYRGPLVFRLDPLEDLPRPRRLDFAVPMFPRRSAPGAPGVAALPRFVSVAASAAAEEVFLLGSLGEVFRLTPPAGLQLLARLPAGHYHRTHMAVAPDGNVFVSSGFHIRDLFRISLAGVVTIVARELGDPAGVVIDHAGTLYVVETALHRIIRIRPVHDR